MHDLLAGTVTRGIAEIRARYGALFAVAEDRVCGARPVADSVSVAVPAARDVLECHAL